MRFLWRQERLAREQEGDDGSDMVLSIGFRDTVKLGRFDGKVSGIEVWRLASWDDISLGEMFGAIDDIPTVGLIS
jgi:hypothetical protein